MDQKTLEQKIIDVESVLADETLADGLSILSATLASIIVGAIQDGQFDRYKLGEYFSELENRILKTFDSNAGRGISRSKGIKRE
jgi:hypothetical protein